MNNNPMMSDLFSRVAELIEQSRKYIAKAVNTAMVATYYEIGRYIIEDEQQGKTRAEYGKRILLELSKRLTDRFGKGWSVDTLKRCRLFYIMYSIPKNAPLVTQLKKCTTGALIENPEMSAAGQQMGLAIPSFVLSWSHYLILMRIDNPDERSFYEIEACKQNWSKRDLQRQIGSSLYERLALSKDKDEVMRLAKEGQIVEKSSDVIKDPLVLEFIGLQPEAVYSESKLEQKIIDKMQQFLMEMGKGFLFEARQKRFTFDERHFYVDLVLYNRLLQCYVLVDLKMDDLTHQDIGQMQMYVNYYDRYVRQEWEKPTIGILLCEQKSDAIVELTLPEDTNIYATQYTLCLPDKATLQRKLKEWIEEE